MVLLLYITGWVEMIKVKQVETGNEFEVSNEHWEEVLSRRPAYVQVVEEVKKAAPKRGRPRKEKA